MKHKKTYILLSIMLFQSRFRWLFVFQLFAVTTFAAMEQQCGQNRISLQDI